MTTEMFFLTCRFLESSDEDYAAEYANENAPPKAFGKQAPSRAGSAPSGPRKVSASSAAGAKPRPGTGTVASGRTAKPSVTSSANPVRKKGNKVLSRNYFFMITLKKFTIFQVMT